MIVWIDAQISPAIAWWLRDGYGVEAATVREIGLRDASDRDIFFAARKATAVVMTKDRDFVHLLELHGPPPQVVWITCGNTSNARLKEILDRAWPTAMSMLASGERLVEISDVSV